MKGMGADGLNQSMWNKQNNNRASSTIGINTRIILQITKGTSVQHDGTVCAWIIAIYNPYRCDHVSSDLLLIEIINEIFTSNAIVHTL